MKVHALIEDLHHRADCEDARHQTSGFSHHQENARTMREAAAELARLLLAVPVASVAAPGEVEAPRGSGGSDVSKVPTGISRDRVWHFIRVMENSPNIPAIAKEAARLLLWPPLEAAHALAEKWARAKVEDRRLDDADELLAARLSEVLKIAWMHAVLEVTPDDTGKA